MVLPEPPHAAESSEVWTGNTSIPQWNFFGPDKFDVFHLRALFYLLTPNEVANLTGPNHNLTYAEEAHHVQDIFSDTIPVFMILCLIEALVSFIVTGRPFPISDTITSWSAGLLSHMTKICVKTLDVGLYTWLFTHYRLTIIPMDTWWAWTAALLATDFGYYWFHRASHEINLFWAAHQVHHSSEEFNFSVALRQSVVSNFGAWAFYLPMAIVGLTPATFLIHHQLNLLYQFWIHTSLIKSLGPLEWVLNTPSHHRAHHGRNPLYIDINYGGVLIIWDRLFGTFLPENEKEPALYGLVGRLHSHNAVWVQVLRLAEIKNLIAANSTIGDKISAALKGPRWRPGLPFFGLLDRTVPITKKEEHPERKYQSKVPQWQKVYATVHFLTVMPWFLAMLRGYENREPHSTPETLLTFVHMTISLANIGSVFDGRSWIPLTETARCAFLFLFFDLLPGLEDEYTCVTTVMRAVLLPSVFLWPVRHYLAHTGEVTPIPTEVPFVVSKVEKSQ